MADGRAVAGTSLSEEVRSAFKVLGDDEYRRWAESCQALEAGHEYPWAETESRMLVSAVLGCLFGEDLARLDAPARDWARTNSTMAVFTRRLGCLRELIGQEGVLNGPEATLRAHQVFDRVSIVGTEVALATLTYALHPSPPRIADADTPAPSDLVADHSSNPLLETPVGGNTSTTAVDVPHGPSVSEDEACANDEMHSEDAERVDPGRRGRAAPRIRRRTFVALIGVAVAALVTALAFALPSSSPRQHVPRHRGGAGPTATTTVARPGATHTSGTGGERSNGSQHTTSGGAAGTPTNKTTASTGAAGAAGGASGGSNGNGSGGGSGGTGNSSGVTLPGGTPVTVPQVTLPQANAP